MSTHISIGFSKNPVPEKAFNEAAVSLKNQLNQPAIDLLIILLTPAFAKQECFPPLRRILNHRQSIGAVTPGIIMNERIEPCGVAILGITSDEILIETAGVENIGSAPLRETAFKIARTLETSLHVKQRFGSFFFFNNLSKNASPIHHGLRDNFGHSFVIAGAVPCDNKLNNAPVIFNDKIMTDALVGCLWGGRTSTAVSGGHGWHAIGKPRIITHATKNFIHTIDNKPAISIYENYFKDELTPPTNNKPFPLQELSLLYPLGLHTGPKEYSIHHAVTAMNDGTLVLQTEIPPNSCVHLMIGDKESCRQAARNAAAQISQKLGRVSPKIIFITESIARQKLFGRNPSLKTSEISEIIGLNVPIFGMHSYGELAPQGTFKETNNTPFQSASIVLTAIG